MGDSYPQSGLTAAERAGGYRVIEAKRTGREAGWTKARETLAKRRAWVVSRHAAVVQNLLGRGFTIERAWVIALALVSHYVRECGWGRAEWNWSLGNIRWTRGYALAHMLNGGDDSEPRPYRAYASLAEGVEDAVKLASTGPKTRARPQGIYAPSWAKLTAGGDPFVWYDELVHAGWHPWSREAMDEFRQIYGTVRGMAGEKPPVGGAASLAALLALAALAAVVMG